MEGSETYEVGEAVQVRGHGNGVVAVEPDELGFYTITLEGGEPFRASIDLLTPNIAARSGEEETAVAEPPSVFEQLGRDYATATEDRRETFPIVPGRFHGNLLMRARPVDPTKRKKKVRRISKTGITDESEARYAAEIIAEACDCILVRLKDGDEPIPAHEVPNAGLGDEPVRFDSRLGLVVPALGELLTGDESPATRVRLLFKNMDALDGFYVELDQWLKETTPTEEGDEEGQTERPS